MDEQTTRALRQAALEDAHQDPEWQVLYTEYRRLASGAYDNDLTADDWLVAVNSKIRGLWVIEKHCEAARGLP